MAAVTSRTSEANLHGADPLARAGERRRLVADADEALLDLAVARHGRLHVALQQEPRTDRLQRPVGAAPAVVVEVVLSSTNQQTRSRTQS